jgi:hypothetical protein
MQVVVVTKESAPLQCSVSTELYGAQCDVDVVYRCSVPPHFQGDALHCMDSKRSTHSRTQLNLNHIATCKSVRQRAAMHKRVLSLFAAAAAVGCTVASNTGSHACWTAEDPDACASVGGTGTLEPGGTAECHWCDNVFVGGRGHCFTMSSGTACPTQPDSRLPDSEYSTDALVARLKRGSWFGESSGVPTDFECAWREAACVNTHPPMHAITLLHTHHLA